MKCVGTVHYINTVSIIYHDLFNLYCFIIKINFCAESTNI